MDALQEDTGEIFPSFADWITIFVREAIKSNGEIVTSQDLKNLRGTCKLAKELVDKEPWCSKLVVDIDILLDADYGPLAASPLLGYIHELAIHGGKLPRDTDEIIEFWERNGPHLLSIIRTCAPNLERFKVSVKYEHRPGGFLLPSVLLKENCEFGKLKSLVLYPFGYGEVESVQATLFSMTSLQKLVLGNLTDGCDSYLDELDLDILAQAPFWGNLTDLNVGLPLDGYVFPLIGPESMDVLTSMLTQTAHTLQNFVLRGAQGLQCFSDAPFTNLENLEIRYSHFDKISLPRSLVKLKIVYSTFVSPEDFFANFISGNLARLTTLFIARSPRHGGILEHGAWSDYLQDFNLPVLESLTLLDDQGILLNDVFFGLVEAAPTIPKLREVEVLPRTSGLDPNLVSRFCSSPLAAKLETLKLIDAELDDDAFKELIDGAPHMKCLRSLELTIGQKRKIESIAEAGALGCWPVLNKMHLDITESPNQKGPWTRFCLGLFDPVWPDLDFSCAIEKDPLSIYCGRVS